MGCVRLDWNFALQVGYVKMIHLHVTLTRRSLLTTLGKVPLSIPVRFVVPSPSRSVRVTVVVVVVVILYCHDDPWPIRHIEL